jgi:hypothetical protein
MVTLPTNNEQGGTAIDLVWGNEEAENLIIKCHTIEANNDHVSDHLAIEIILNICPKTAPPPAPPYNFEKTNWDLLRAHLRLSMPPLSEPTPLPQNLTLIQRILQTPYKMLLPKPCHARNPALTVKDGGLAISLT